MTLVLRYSARSDRGLVRQNNQDAVYAGPRLLALADGMGGHAAGEVASSLVISALAPLDEDDPGDDLLRELRDATVEGNAAITQHVRDAPDLEGMGTTLTAILFAGSRLGLVHIGDSRAYQLRGGTFTQITKDDTFVQSLIDEGRITEEEAHTHPQRSLLLRAITGQDIDPSLTIREARAGDRYLLCSDGLSGVVSDETLADTLRGYRDPRECADRMIDLALRGGGPDNITCIVADVLDIEFGEDAPIVGGAAGDGRDDDVARPDSSAARASAATMTRPAPQRTAPAAQAPAAKRSRARLLIAALAVLVVLVGGGLLARIWVLQQYYVGADTDRVTIFQGVQGDVLGVPLHTVAERTDIALDDLTESDRSLVRGGIDAAGLEGAQGVVERLRTKMLAPCPAPTAQTPETALVPTLPDVTFPDYGTTPLPSVPPEPGINCRPVG
ncbi:protein phosphatase 2C domain-containing protein [Pseudonocardia petroleophila]|uniref:Serine/threonine protein phosphatase PstP n=1 Tax=Pseudonocardia petroleophila TaxID=37331 RepID=A0A7G7MM53_9PSEU|nr:PP2C family serine/threonine-protein phosphatase [Pseudonocardia petroleophila]QNG53864.1 serine/threonine-protein phosphatase [Pseudonocardia petroleophila]